MNSRAFFWMMTALIVAIIAGAPIGYASYVNANHRNIRTVKPGVLYRSGQLSASGLDQLARAQSIRTIISLRDTDDPGLPAPDAREEAYCAANDIKFIRIPPRSWWPDKEGRAPAETGINAFLAVLDDEKNFPVLVHCFAGTHRTGAMVAIYRMEYEHWTHDDALLELRQNGYVHLDRELDVLTFLRNYKPRWQR